MMFTMICNELLFNFWDIADNLRTYTYKAQAPQKKKKQKSMKVEGGH